LLSVYGNSTLSNLTATGTLSVLGASTLTGALTVYGNSTLSNLTATGTLSVSGSATLTSLIAKTGSVRLLDSLQDDYVQDSEYGLVVDNLYIVPGYNANNNTEAYLNIYNMQDPANIKLAKRIETWTSTTGLGCRSLMKIVNVGDYILAECSGRIAVYGRLSDLVNFSFLGSTDIMGYAGSGFSVSGKYGVYISGQNNFRMD